MRYAPLAALVLVACGLLGMVTAARPSQQLNRPIGVYPGRPSEYFGPTLSPGDSLGYRNLALHRTVWQSGAYDFNLTSQLLTDGIVSHTPPAWLRVTTPSGELPVHQRESTIDGNEWTCNIVMGANTWLQYDWQNLDIDADAAELVCSMAYDGTAASGYCLRLLTSPDGHHWRLADEWRGDTLPGDASTHRVHSDPNKAGADDNPLLPTRRIAHRFALGDGPFGHLRLELCAPAAVHWTITELRLRHHGRDAAVLPASHFVSAWRSSGDNAWVSVDLGSEACVDAVRLHWLSTPTTGTIEVGDDTLHWRQAATFTADAPHKQQVSTGGTQARYVRINFHNTAPVCLAEVEVLGHGGLVALPHPGAAWSGDRWLLDGGDWRLQRASQVALSGERLSLPGCDTTTWLPATVPATVLSSFVNAGALPDMNHADNLLMASESLFEGDYWYRRTFDLPDELADRRVTLGFDGINWKAEVWLNGQRVDNIEGAFYRGRCDVSGIVRRRGNVLAVRIIANAHPGGVKLKTERNTDYNGGILGADNPTFHATVGWDWISTIRGRDMGIWDDVFLRGSGDVTLADPVVTTTLGAADTLATICPSVLVTNHASHAVRGTLRGTVGPLAFEQEVMLPADTAIEVTFAPERYRQLSRQALPLWWPAGHGAPYMHESSYIFVIDRQVSDSLHYRTGLRQVHTTGRDSCLRLWVNNHHVVPMGGNWAFSECNLNYRQREYDAAVRHHREMNYNMLRNWVGMTADTEFYDACDRYGIMVWQDFWLANPADGPDPADEAMFARNALDLVHKVRQHPCLAIYCGRNEGYPPPTLDAALRHIVATAHPQLDYIASSADDGVSGHGPYHALQPEEYFTRQTGKLHTERGMPCMMTIDGLRRALGDNHLWPQDVMWGRHDFTLEGAQRGAVFNKLIDDNFGPMLNADEYTQWAQWINYEGYRAMYESDRGMGLLIWMSHPCWPSLVWQTYDYYFEPTAAYYGVKHACEPVHVQWNAATRHVEVVNRSATRLHGTVTATLTALDGTTLSRTTMPYDDDTTADAMTVDTPQGYEGVYLMRLTLADANGSTLSANDYVLSTAGHDRRALRTMRATTITASIATIATATDGTTRATITLTNTGNVPAMMLRLNLRGSDGEQILPVFYNDNYVHLLPGECRTFTVEWHGADARSTTPQLELSAANVPTATLRL